jgi:hypothetical protein
MTQLWVLARQVPPQNASLHVYQEREMAHRQTAFTVGNYGCEWVRGRVREQRPVVVKPEGVG